MQSALALEVRVTMGQELTVFRGRAGDHNDLAMRGSVLIANDLSQRLGLTAQHIGHPEPAVNADWETELLAALPALKEMAAAYHRILSDSAVPVTALSRCTVALATLPVVARYRPDACVVWLDAHADLNTPQNTATGYLGGLALAGAAGMWDSGLGSGLALQNVVLGGARDMDPPEQQLVDDGIVRAVSADSTLPEQLRDAVAGRPVYFHIDCDVLEPGTVPTDYRVPNGISLEVLHDVSRVVAEHEVVGIEIGEFEGAWSLTDDPFSPSELLDAMQPLFDAAS